LEVLLHHDFAIFSGALQVVASEDVTKVIVLGVEGVDTDGRSNWTIPEGGRERERGREGGGEREKEGGREGERERERGRGREKGGERINIHITILLLLASSRFKDLTHTHTHNGTLVSHNTVGYC
jgi:hypothetical protein